MGRSYAGGPTGAELFSLELVAINTAFLLLSSLTFGLAMLQKQKKLLLLPVSQRLWRNFREDMKHAWDIFSKRVKNSV